MRRAGFLTAQSNTKPGQDAGYVFDHCRLTADAGMGRVFIWDGPGGIIRR